MQQAVEERNRGRLYWQEVAPLLEWPMAGHAQATAFVGGGHETKEQLGTRVIERSKSQLVDQDQLMAQEVADDLADRVVGQAAVQGFDQISSDQVADLQAAFYGAHAAADQRVAFAGARRSNQEHILFGAYPFERRDVLKGWARDGRVGHLECLERLEHRKTTLLESDTTIGRVTCGNLGL